MNEYIMPVKYQNVGCGISVVVAGLENTYQNYKLIEISRDDFLYIPITINENNVDFTNIVTFDNLEENRFYTIYAKLTTNNDEVIKFNCKMLPQIEVFTVELSPEVKAQSYHGGGIGKYTEPKEVNE